MKIKPLLLSCILLFSCSCEDSRQVEESPASQRVNAPQSRPVESQPTVVAAPVESPTRRISVQTLWSGTRDSAEGTTVTLRLGGGVKRSAQTNASGLAVIEVPEPWRRLMAVARHPESIPETRAINLATTDSLVMTLRKGGVVFGTVKMEDGTPAAGAQILGWDPEASALSAEDGSFELKGQPFGKVRIQAIKGSLTSIPTQEDAPMLEMKDGERLGPLELILHEGRELRGKITSLEDGKPMPGLKLMFMSDLAARITQTNARGRYRIQGLSMGKYNISIMRGETHLMQIQHEISPDSKDELNIAVVAPTLLYGTVLEDATGRPVPYAAVHSTFTGTQAIADEAGRYELVVTPGMSISLMGSHDRLVSLQPLEIAPEKIVVNKRSGPFDLRLQPGVSLRGKVTSNATSQPIAKARVSFSANQSGYMPPQVQTDSQGVYILDGLRPGPGSANAYAEGFAPHGQPFTLTAESPKLDFQLDPEAIIFGFVVGPDGQPVEGATVGADIAGQQQTKKDGTFELKGLSAGLRKIEAWKGDLVSATSTQEILQVTVASGEKSGPHTLSLKPGLTVRGVVRNKATGQPVAGANVSCWSREQRHAKTDASGKFSIGGLQPREVSLNIEMKGYFSSSKQVNPSEGGIVEIELDPAAVVTGKVWLEKSGVPAPDAHVQVRMGNSTHSTNAGADGSFTLMVRGEGAARISAVKPPYISALSPDEAMPIDIKYSGENGPYELILQRGLGVAGTVLDKQTRSPIAGALVVAQSSARARATTDFSGRFTIDGIMEGRLSLVASAANYVGGREQVNVSREGTPECTFLLERGGDVEVTVLDEQNKPFPGADVQLRYEAGGGYGYGGIMPYVHPQMETGEFGDRGGRVMTDAKGIVIMPGVSRSQNFIVVASGQSGFGEARGRFEEGMMRCSITVTVKKQEARPTRTEGLIIGTVRNEEKRPISGAAVTFGLPEHSQYKAISDGAGNYRLQTDGLYEQRIYASAKGYATGNMRMKAGPPEMPGRADFVLKAGHYLDLLVKEANGNPIKSGDVSLNVGDFHQSLTFKPNDKGFMRIENLPDKQVRVSFNSQDGRYASGESYPDQLLELTLVQMGVVRGQVLDAATKQPIQDFRVGRDNEMLQYRHPEGRFTLEKQALDQDSSFQVSAEGYGTQTVRARAVPADSQDVVKIEMNTARVFSGYLVDAVTKARVAGAQLALLVNDRPNEPYAFVTWQVLQHQFANIQMRTAKTGADGSFIFADAPVSGVLLVLAPGYERVVFPTPATPSLDPVSIPLVKGGAISGTVAGATNVQINSGILSIQQTAQTANRNQSFEGAKVDGEKFSWDSLSPGQYNISLSYSYGRNQQSDFNKEVVVEAGKTTEVNIQAPAGQASVFGVVVFGDAPARSMGVRLNEEGEAGQSFSTQTDSRGQYRFENIAPGTYTVRVQGEQSYQRTERKLNVQGPTQADLEILEPRIVKGAFALGTDPAPGQWKIVELKLRWKGRASGEALSYQATSGLRNDQFSFEGRFKGTYDLGMNVESNVQSGPRFMPIQELDLDNLQADQNVGVVNCMPLSMINLKLEVPEEARALSHNCSTGWRPAGGNFSEGFWLRLKPGDNLVGPFADGTVSFEFNTSGYKFEPKPLKVEINGARTYPAMVRAIALTPQP